MFIDKMFFEFILEFIVFICFIYLFYEVIMENILNVNFLLIYLVSKWES